MVYQTHRSHRGGRDVRGGSEDVSRQEKTETVPCEETVAADPFPDSDEHSDTHSSRHN